MPFRLHQDHRRWTGRPFPLDGTSDGIAIPIRPGDLNNRSIG
jgi:hypothetical protein